MISGIDRYRTFGMRQEWLHLFMQKGEGWADNSPLGNRQVQGFRNWLIDAGLWEQERPTPLGEAVIRQRNPGDHHLWRILWACLSYGSPLIRWYAYSIPNGSYTIKDLTEMLALMRGRAGPNRTDVNAISALTNTLKTTPLGEALGVGRVSTEGGEKIITKSIAGEKIPPLALIGAIALYLRSHNLDETSVQSMLWSNPISPCRLFQISDAIFPLLCRSSAQAHPEYISIHSITGSEIIRLNDKTTIENIFLAQYISK